MISGVYDMISGVYIINRGVENGNGGVLFEIIGGQKIDLLENN